MDRFIEVLESNLVIVIYCAYSLRRDMLNCSKMEEVKGRVPRLNSELC